MNNNKSPVLVLDLDGTLVDSKPDLVAALNVGIGSAGLSPMAIETIGESVGQGARAMIAKALEHQNRELSNDTLEEVFELFMKYYRTNIAVNSKPYPGIQTALDRFSENGWSLAICTNKPEDMAKALLSSLNLDEQFAAICGSDTFANRKPHRDHILNTIAMANGNVIGSVMVGDTATDIDAAKNSGIPSIAVDYGYSFVPARTLGADRTISHFDQLWQAVSEI